MSGRTSDATVRAIALVLKGRGRVSAYAAARREGIALSTIYRALKRANIKAPAGRK